MDRKLTIASLIVVALVVVSVAWIYRPQSNIETNDRIYQIGTLQGLVEGEYDGKISVGNLLAHGSMGLGTFAGLDGEMIVIDGKCYRVANDGSVNKVDDDVLTPFASVSDLTESVQVNLHRVANYTGLMEMLLDDMEDGAGFVLIVCHGSFSNITVRSVPAQEKPYPPLPSVLANQSVYHYSNVNGTLVGFYAPPYVGTLDQAGFHLHFISDDLSIGGHLLDVMIEDATAKIDGKSGLGLDL